MLHNKNNLSSSNNSSSNYVRSNHFGSNNLSSNDISNNNNKYSNKNIPNLLEFYFKTNSVPSLQDNIKDKVFILIDRNIFLYIVGNNLTLLLIRKIKKNMVVVSPTGEATPDTKLQYKLFQRCCLVHL
ncbi:hypothetical protein EDEG_01220 [Edhazardia aedis USNM 41457]|uniref:Uncharacterized protein n=1 Tax=Edhazardia aedis (strain USNM 41457) TaxID=1003232 RepID=J9DA24_EDHAE|nr:hypothetical protein EDEG_01220 [Edhazardia aedis USNM 41457]|eukprot:EJW04571.1 hypothetical protein EDEG_01220 [Edhazardia aedis USNM 41457]